MRLQEPKKLFILDDDGLHRKKTPRSYLYGRGYNSVCSGCTHLKAIVIILVWFFLIPDHQ
jgi:hypothetical protein